MNRRFAALAVVATCGFLGLAGCSSAPTVQDASIQPSIATPELSTEAVPASPAPSTCPQFAMTAAHVATYAHYLNLNIGTSNDEKPTLQDLQAGSLALVDLAPKCAPAAAESIAAFAKAAQVVTSTYTTKSDGVEGQQTQEALAALQKAGSQMFTELGMANDAWQ